MSRTTVADVNAAFDRLKRAWRNAGIKYTDYDAQTYTADDLVMQTGSQTYGRAYRLHYQHPTHGGLMNALPTGGDYLGMTRREAVLSLDALTHGIRAATGD